METNRRQFLLIPAGLAIGTMLPLGRLLDAAEPAAAKDVSPAVLAAQGLLYEHALVHRTLIVFDEALRRLRSGQEITAEAFKTCADLLRNFVEDHHEKLEEMYIFPECEKTAAMKPLIVELHRQHVAGRQMTNTLYRAATPERFATPEGRKEVEGCMEATIRMYRPHAAFEDTEVLPAWVALVSERQMGELAADMRHDEDAVLDKGGYQKLVAQVAGMEKQLGIGDLSRVTPH